MTKEALNLALEALEVANSCVDGYYIPKGKAHLPEIELAITAIKEALAQPEQDLVEWGVDWGPDGNSVSIIKRLADGGIEVVGWEYAPHPPQRTWGGLTDEDIGVCLDVGNGSMGKIISAIEAKLKARNI
jgi:hypothetical protein